MAKLQAKQKAETTQMLNYNEAGAKVAARIMTHLNLFKKGVVDTKNKPMTSFFCGFGTRCGKVTKAASFLKTFNLKRGLLKFGEKGKQAATKEMKQLHDREVFIPMDPNTMKPSERKKILESLVFLVKKRDGTIEAHTCANGSVLGWMDKMPQVQLSH